MFCWVQLVSAGRHGNFSTRFSINDINLLLILCNRPVRILEHLPDIKHSQAIERFIPCFSHTSFVTTGVTINTSRSPLQTAPQSAQVTALSTAYGRAQPYYQENSTSINCYGYAAGFPWAMNPGDCVIP
jgi:hypothetical protein